VPQHAALPTTRYHTFTTYKDGQTEILLKVFEGEGSLCRDLNFMGRYIIKGIQAKPKGVAQIEVRGTCRFEGNMQIEVREKSDLLKFKNLI
jgi:molecular chaperone DnaK (HSP70)